MHVFADLLYVEELLHVYIFGLEEGLQDDFVLFFQAPGFFTIDLLLLLWEDCIEVVHVLIDWPFILLLEVDNIRMLELLIRDFVLDLSLCQYLRQSLGLLIAYFFVLSLGVLVKVLVQLIQP